MARVISTLRNHLHFLVVVIVLIAAMTWPTIRYVFDTEIFWLPTKVFDVWINFWDAWHFELFVTGNAELLFTDLIFYPNGVSLAFDTPTYPQILVFNALKVLMTGSNAYNLTYLLIIFATTLSAYVYLLYLLRHRWISLFGAIIFGCSVYVVARPSEPNVTTIATVPLSLYFLHRAVLERRWLFTALSGILIGFTVVIGIYTYISLLIALCLYLLYFALGFWNQPVFWMRVVLVLAIAGSLGVLRFSPMMRDADGLSSALTKRGGEEFNTDLVFYFVNLDHPVTTPVFRQLFGVEIDPRWNTSYLGYIPMILITYGFLRARFRRKMLFWFYLMIPFLILRLGSFLTVNGQQFTEIVLPKELLDRLIPSVFTAIYSPDFFHSVTLLPLAVLSCYGLMTLLQSVSRRLRLPVIVLLIVGLAFEYYTSLDPMVVPDDQLAFLDWLADEDDPSSIRLVNVPMGRVDAKLYDFYQTLSGYPHVEGTAGRTPPEAYTYINDNILLNTWSEDESIPCQLTNQDQYLVALDSLARDGFTHVVNHRFLWNSGSVKDSFIYADPSFHNDYTSVFRIADLRQSCPDNMPGHEMVAHLNQFFRLSTPTPKNNVSILSLHPTQPINSKLFQYFSQEAEVWKSLIHLSQDEQNQLRIQTSRTDFSTVDSIIAGNSILWLVFEPQQTNPQAIPAFTEAFSAQYRSCQRLHSSFNIIVEQYVRKTFPCELADAQSSLAVLYDSGIHLAERMVEVGEDQLRVYLWWSEHPLNGTYAYSIQVFDEGGVKVTQEDYIIGFDPLVLHEIDISSFERGHYSARLIVYHVSTKQSQSGTIVQNQQSFRRELEIASFDVDA